MLDILIAVCKLDITLTFLANRYGKNEWRDDMKKLLKRTGLEAKQTVFLFTDMQIIHETFLEVRSHPKLAHLPCFVCDIGLSHKNHLLQ